MKATLLNFFEALPKIDGAVTVSAQDKRAMGDLGYAD